MKMNYLAVILTVINLILLTIILVQNQETANLAAANVLRASAIELVDDHGRVRAQFNVEPNGEVVFRLRDEAGTIRVKLGASQNGSGLLLLNNSTEPGIHLLTDQNVASITLNRPGGAPLVIEP